jgi:hypothetical protein
MIGEAAKAAPAERSTISAATAIKIVVVRLMSSSFPVCPGPLPSC